MGDSRNCNPNVCQQAFPLPGHCTRLACPGRNGDHPSMDSSDVLFDTSIPNLPMIGRGKVRDIYSVDDNHLLIVTTDRLSPYDLLLPHPVPANG